MKCECQQAFDTVKSRVVKDTRLAYFDNRMDLFLQVDSSQNGIGTALIQEGRTIEYASKSLSETQQKWAQIEKELLAVVAGLEKFDQYTYGRRVYVQNDQKPLENILCKPLCQAPRRLQNLLMRLHRYDCEFQYVEGPQLFIADTLSRAVSKDSSHKVPDLQINMVSTISDTMLERIRAATEKDQHFQALRQYTCMGWPSDKCSIGAHALPYWQIRDIIS